MSNSAQHVPSPNDPQLPPQLAEFKDKTTDEVLAELNRMPFFMTKLDDTDGEGGENVQLEALKALAYEGEPHEVAENFKNQGNDLYKAKRFKDAREIYKKGLSVKCGVAKIDESLYSNIAACELELKNFRSCINCCREALSLNPKNIKCYYRMGKAFFKLDRFDEARDSIEFGLKVDAQNKSLHALLETVQKRERQIAEYEEKRRKEEETKRNLQTLLENALIVRNVKSIKTKHRNAELLDEAKLKLENPTDFESQMIYPALVMYPTTGEFDFIAEVGELSSVQDLLDLIMQRPQEWFDEPKHKDFTPKKLLAYMETESGGLVKAGKKMTFHDILKKETPRVPLFDDALKIYLVPKTESEEWIAKWDRKDALERRG